MTSHNSSNKISHIRKQMSSISHNSQRPRQQPPGNLNRHKHNRKDRRSNKLATDPSLLQPGISPFLLVLGQELHASHIMQTNAHATLIVAGNDTVVVAMPVRQPAAPMRAGAAMGLVAVPAMSAVAHGFCFGFRGGVGVSGWMVLSQWCFTRKR